MYFTCHAIYTVVSSVRSITAVSSLYLLEHSQRTRRDPVSKRGADPMQNLGRQRVLECARRLLAEFGIHRTRRPRTCGKSILHSLWKRGLISFLGPSSRREDDHEPFLRGYPRSIQRPGHRPQDLHAQKSRNIGVPDPTRAYRPGLF